MVFMTSLFFFFYIKERKVCWYLEERPREFPTALYCLAFKQLNSCGDVSKSKQSLVWLLTICLLPR